MNPAVADQVVETWRNLSAGNRTAASFLAIVDAMPDDDPENRAAAVSALCRGLPRLSQDAAELIRWTGRLWADIYAGKLDADAPEGLDVLDFLKGPDDADR